MLSRALGFWRATEGLAAIELGLVAPVLATLLLGTVELCNALEANQRVYSVAASVADLVTQESNVATADLTNIYGAGNAIMFPFSIGSTTIVITSIVNKSNQNTVCWSQAQNGTPYTKGTVMTVPTGLIAVGGSVLLVQITYTYTSPVGKLILGTFPMTDSFYAHPRLSTQVDYNGTGC
jgi:Flp pilus assembly protein TadG